LNEAIGAVSFVKKSEKYSFSIGSSFNNIPIL